MADEIEVLGCVAREVPWLTEGTGAMDATTPFGTVRIERCSDGNGWCATWWPRRQRWMDVALVSYAHAPADAAREATRRLRAIQRTCARAGAL